MNVDERTKLLFEKFDSLLDHFPDMQLLKEIALKGENNESTEDEFDNYLVDDDSFAIHKKALNLTKERNISYKEAIVSLITTNN